MAEFPNGDNFRARGPWRILAGRSWFEWECAALEAELVAAGAAGDEVTACRLRRRLATLRRRGPVRARPG